MTETIVHTGITELFSCCKGGKDFVSHCECCCGKMSTNLVNSDSSFYNSSDENDTNSSNDVSIELTNADKKLDHILTTISSINMSVVELTNRVNDLEKKLIVNELTTSRNRSVPIGFDYVSSLTPDSTGLVGPPNALVVAPAAAAPVTPLIAANTWLVWKLKNAFLLFAKNSSNLVLLNRIDISCVAISPL